MAVVVAVLHQDPRVLRHAGRNHVRNQPRHRRRPQHFVQTLDALRTKMRVDVEEEVVDILHHQPEILQPELAGQCGLPVELRHVRNLADDRHRGPGSRASAMVTDSDLTAYKKHINLTGEYSERGGAVMELELTLLAGPVNLPGEAPPEEAGENLDGREARCDFLFSIRRLRHRSPRWGRRSGGADETGAFDPTCAGRLQVVGSSPTRSRRQIKTPNGRGRPGSRPQLISSPARQEACWLCSERKRDPEANADVVDVRHRVRRRGGVSELCAGGGNLHPLAADYSLV